MFCDALTFSVARLDVELDAYLGFWTEVSPTPMLDDYPTEKPQAIPYANLTPLGNEWNEWHELFPNLDDFV